MKTTPDINETPCPSQEELQAYLLGHAEHLEAHIASCPLCVGALEEMDLKDPNGAVTWDTAVDTFQSSLREHTNSSPPIRSILKYAAALLVLLISTWFLIDHFQPSSPAELFAEHFEPYQVFQDRDEAPDSNDYFQKGIEQYQKHQYEAAIPFFEKLLNQDPSLKMARFYLGNAQLATGNAHVAIKYFKDLDQPSHPLYEQAQWYLLLAYLQAGQNPEAMEMAQKIADGKGFYALKASAILAEI